MVFAAGFVAGAVAGVLGFLLYMRHRTKKQLKQVEEQMGDMLELEEE